MRRDLDVSPNAIDTLRRDNYKGVDLAALVEDGGIVDGDFAFSRSHLEEVCPVDLVPRSLENVILVLVWRCFVIVFHQTIIYPTFACCNQ